jgi:hypothetical protein
MSRKAMSILGNVLEVASVVVAILFQATKGGHAPMAPINLDAILTLLSGVGVHLVSPHHPGIGNE